METSVPTCSRGDGNSSIPPKKKKINPAKHWDFVINNYTEHHIKMICSNCSIKRYVFQEEIGESGTKHLQGYVEFKKKSRPLSEICLDGVSWRVARNINALISYCSCPEKRSYFKEKTGKDSRLFTNIKLPKPISVIENLYPWQEEVVNIILEEPDDRTIHWFWDTNGNKGKSALCKYLVVKHDAVIVSGKGTDVKYMIVKYHEKNKVYPEVIIYDIPRSNENYISYTAIEEIKNGLFASSKYECEMVVMNSPHIICFANFEPNYESMSLDRWSVKEL